MELHTKVKGMCHDCSHGGGAASEPERVMPFLLGDHCLVAINAASGSTGSIGHGSMDDTKRRSRERATRGEYRV